MSTLQCTKRLRTLILTTLLPSSGELTNPLHLDLFISAEAHNVRHSHLHHTMKVSGTLEVVKHKQQENRDPAEIPWGYTNKGEVDKHFPRTYPLKNNHL